MNEDKSVNRLTVVGGQPSAKNSFVISNNIERLLLKASFNKKFKNILLHNREALFEGSDFSLTHQDKIILNSIPGKKLEGMIEKFSRQRTSRRNFLKGAAATVALVATGCIASKETTPPDEPSIHVYRQHFSEGIRPDIPDNTPVTCVTEEIVPEAAYYMVSEWTLQNVKDFNETEIGKLKSLQNKQYADKKEFIEILSSFDFNGEQIELILQHSQVTACKF